jgi:hypothetical protein
MHILTEIPPATTHDPEAAQLAADLGLKIQAARYSKAPVLGSFTPMTQEEIILWSHHCPTVYSTHPWLDPERTKNVETYAFDSIPVEVMRHWKLIQDNYAFDRYGIWTTEKTINKDPLLIGVLGPDRFLLARWGLESPGEMSLKDIAKKVYDDLCQEADYLYVRPNLRKREERFKTWRNWTLNKRGELLKAAEKVLGMR